MPNWCSNKIEINGTKENMKPIYDFFKENEEGSDELVMNALVPHDEDYNKIKEGGQFLLNPQTVFYGTKWDFEAREANIEIIDETSITITPDTAWSPPVEFCKRLSDKYKVDVVNFFDEPGIGFVGVHKYYSNGEEEIEEYENYMEGLYYLDNEKFWEELQYNMEFYKNEEELSLETLKEKLFSFITDEKELEELEDLYNEEY
jgi:hypothetical protein